ncbi:hypothetical protein CLBKND_01016 [Methylorubrum aminovorans]
MAASNDVKPVRRSEDAERLKGGANGRMPG